MKKRISVGRAVSTLEVAVLVAAAMTFGGCGRDDDRPSTGAAGSGATETNVAPAPCSSHADCPDGIDCKFFDGGAADAGGFCDVGEMEVTGGGAPVSSAAPAPCSRDSEAAKCLDVRLATCPHTAFESTHISDNALA